MACGQMVFVLVKLSTRSRLGILTCKYFMLWSAKQLDQHFIVIR